ncbi:biotin--[acetyl-CoA-carboxylase] ligase [Pseudactinotalea sp. HY158]|nr:biotin--[acetyl-CoA-carboxylase] ligase [Pseudactinotalea sp. HY158]
MRAPNRPPSAPFVVEGPQIGPHIGPHIGPGIRLHLRSGTAIRRRIERVVHHGRDPWHAGVMIRLVPSTDSTQTDLLAALAADGADWGHLSGIHAVHQRAGRGRLDRAWDTDLVRALTASVVLRPGDEATWGGLGLLTGVAVVRALADLAPGVDAGLKWPNDVIVPDAAPSDRTEGSAPGWAGIAKIGGILGSVATDSTGARAAVVGIGVNLDGTVPIPWAATVRSAGGDGVLEAADLLTAILGHLGELVPEGEPVRGVGEAVAPLCRTLGEPVRVVTARDAEATTGTAERIDPDGALVVRTRSGEQRFLAGDVFHIRSEAPLA